MEKLEETQSEVVVDSNACEEIIADDSEKAENVQEVDPYAYLEREDLTTEKYKFEIKNLLKFYGINEFRKLLNEKLKLDSCKIKTPRRNSPYAFVCFRNDAGRETALKTLSSFEWKGKLLNAIRAKPAPDPLVKKRKEIAEDENENKRAKIDVQSQEEKLKCSTTPFWNVPYEEQLKIKQESVKKVLIKLGNELSHHNASLRKWQHDEYRNKCEFTVGINEETGLPTVGFRIGSYVKGITGVGPVDSLKHIPQSMKVAVGVFQQFVVASGLQVFNPELQSGHFKQLTVRTMAQEMMLIA